MEPTTLLMSIKAVTTLVKSLSEASKTMDRAEMGGVIIKLNDAIMDLQIQQQEFITENSQLREENRQLNENINIKENLEYHYGAYWITKDDGSLDGPFSQKSWDNEQKLFRLIFYNKGKYSERGECYHFKYTKNDKTGRPRTEEECLAPAKFIEKHKVPILNEI